jgi:nucleoside 2-deoxyribosyltransferase
VNTYIYVAGASAEVEPIGEYINKLRKEGLRITHDWTREVKLAKAAGRSDQDFDVEERQKLADNDIRGVENCDIFWLIVPNNSIGAWVEYGYALSLRKLIIVSGNFNRTIFLEKVSEFSKFTSHDNAFKHIVELYKSQEWLP